MKLNVEHHAVRIGLWRRVTGSLFASSTVILLILAAGAVTGVLPALVVVMADEYLAQPSHQDRVALVQSWMLMFVGFVATLMLMRWAFRSASSRHDNTWAVETTYRVPSEEGSASR